MRRKMRRKMNMMKTNQNSFQGHSYSLFASALALLFVFVWFHEHSFLMLDIGRLQSFFSSLFHFGMG